jgi:predicted amidohydrolase YtcJ
MVGESQYFVDLQDCYSISSVQDKLRVHIAKFPDLPWVIGVNWDQTKIGRYLCRQDLDELECDKPVLT